MKKNNVKNNTIKAALILGAALAFAAPAATLIHPQNVMASCFDFGLTYNASTSETYNGITKTTKTTNESGKSETIVEYTDENGNLLDEEIGEKAFEAAKSGIENPLEYVQGTSEVDVRITDASFYFVNDTDVDITGLYMTLNDCDDWGDTWLSDDYVLEAGDTGSVKDCISYTKNNIYKIGIDTADGKGIDFVNQCFGKCEDPENVTVTFTMEDGSFYIHIN